MVIFLSIIAFEGFNCSDQGTPKTVEGLASFFVSWKPKKSMKLFGKNW